MSCEPSLTDALFGAVEQPWTTATELLVERYEDGDISKQALYRAKALLDEWDITKGGPKPSSIAAAVLVLQSRQRDDAVAVSTRDAAALFDTTFVTVQKTINRYESEMMEKMPEQRASHPVSES